ncbi:hypothetical protein C8Q75DRAFT_406696 [Abortiporus biennis]|nr:hypothetical protein C8Q75DRAFT_406696 [Abortiporus biennis]
MSPIEQATCNLELTRVHPTQPPLPRDLFDSLDEDTALARLHTFFCSIVTHLCILANHLMLTHRLPFCRTFIFILYVFHSHIEADEYEQTFRITCPISQSSPSSSPGINPISPKTLSTSKMTTTISSHAPSAFEPKAYYNSITRNDDHPILIYRSNHLTTPFPRPIGRFANPTIKTLRGVFNTSLNPIWDTIGPQIRDLIKSRKIRKMSIDPARIFHIWTNRRGR